MPSTVFPTFGLWLIVANFNLAPSVVEPKKSAMLDLRTGKPMNIPEGKNKLHFITF